MFCLLCACVSETGRSQGLLNRTPSNTRVPSARHFEESIIKSREIGETIYLKSHIVNLTLSHVDYFENDLLSRTLWLARALFHFNLKRTTNQVVWTHFDIEMPLAPKSHCLGTSPIEHSRLHKPQIITHSVNLIELIPLKNCFSHNCFCILFE